MGIRIGKIGFPTARAKGIDEFFSCVETHICHDPGAPVEGRGLMFVLGIIRMRK
ncbi:MAG TPA: hypothetical protein VGT24_04350 [Candidatus Acidoferrales bacterium]|nr:hypothetical protein [Candidatus Acidoferrales bacterium]